MKLIKVARLWLRIWKAIKLKFKNHQDQLNESNGKFSKRMMMVNFLFNHKIIKSKSNKKQTLSYKNKFEMMIIRIKKNIN